MVLNAVHLNCLTGGIHMNVSTHYIYEILGLPCMRGLQDNTPWKVLVSLQRSIYKKAQKRFEAGVDVHYTEMKYAHFCTAIWHSDLQSTATANPYLFTAADQTAYW